MSRSARFTLITALTAGLIAWLTGVAYADIDSKSIIRTDSHGSQWNGWDGQLYMTTQADAYRDHNGTPNNDHDDSLNFGTGGLSGGFLEITSSWSGFLPCSTDPSGFCWSVRSAQNDDVNNCNVKVQKLDLAGPNNYVTVWSHDYGNDGSFPMADIWIDWDHHPRLRVECSYDGNGPDKLTSANLITKSAWVGSWES